MAPKSTSNAGIRQLSNGESVIPSSTRADGTVRKEIRVKPGYKPPEDVEVYKNRTAEAWKHRGKAGVPGAEALNTGENDVQNAATSSKNAKRREARRRAAAAAQDHHDGEDAEDAQDVQLQANGVAFQTNGNATTSTEIVDGDVENGKEARKLAKKLRQARDLQEKKEKGDELLPEQFAKVIKINELIRQLDSLGFDADGQRKDQLQDDDDDGDEAVG